MENQLTAGSATDFGLLPVGDSMRPADREPRGELPVVDLASDTPLPAMDQPGPIAPAAAVPTVVSASAAERSGTFWLDGDVLMCACPDCRAPMSVRLWLMVADCWNCGTSIELSDEQEREARRLIERRQAVRPSAPSAASAAPPLVSPAAVESLSAGPPVLAASSLVAAPPRTAAAVPPLPLSPPTLPPPVPPDAASKIAPAAPAGIAPSGDGRGSNKLQRDGDPAVSESRGDGRTQAAIDGRRRRAAAQRLDRRRRGSRFRRLLRNMPAWLISLIFHLIVLTLLALLTIPGEDDGEYITLNAIVSRDWPRVGQDEIPHPADMVRFDLPVPEEVDLEDRQAREALVRADQEARELRLVETSEPLPELDDVKQRIRSTHGASVALAARDPRVRVEMIQQEGGTTLTEAAVARGLRWLAGQQQPDGRWRLEAGAQSDSAATSLALLPFLGAGQTHLSGRYRPVVARGLRWLVEHQREDGDLRAGSAGNTGMYAHGQGAIVLCEAFLMTGDEQLRLPAQRAVDFITAAQYPDGGWRYKPAKETAAHERRSDTSVVGWQLMALHSARAAGLKIPDETWELSGHFLDSVQSGDGSRYAYQSSTQATHVMTAEALLCRIYLGWTQRDPGLMEGVQWLADSHPPRPAATNIYYWYYASQTFHHVGGTHWERWNLKMRDILVNTQQRQGRHAGSWEPRGEHASAGGRVYMTSLAVCTLEIYYRHLPIFRQIDLK